MNKLNLALLRAKMSRARYVVAACAVLTVSLSSCQEDGGTLFPNPRVLIKPKGPAPAFAPTIDPQMLAVIEQFQSYETPPLPTLSPRQARMAPSITDAVQDLLKKNNVPPRPAQVDITQRVLPSGITPQSAPDGLLVRIYKPKNAAGSLPVVVYYHGGGWVIGSLDVYEPSAKAIAEKAQAIVVSVDYRLSPENKFPAAHEDAYAAYQWVKENAASLGGNPGKVAVAGESAGGNMAVTTALLAPDIIATALEQHRRLLGVERAARISVGGGGCDRSPAADGPGPNSALARSGPAAGVNSVESASSVSAIAGSHGRARRLGAVGGGGSYRRRAQGWPAAAGL